MKCLLRVPSRLIGAGGRPAAEAEGGGLDGGRGEGGAAPLQRHAVVVHVGESVGGLERVAMARSLFG